MLVTAAIAVTFLLTPPAIADRRQIHYGPKGNAFGEGYKHSVEKDGSWRIVTEYHGGDPITAMDVALYRAAEMAREAGRPYVQIIGGALTSSYGVHTEVVFARPADSATPPAACRGKRCYTADVAKVLEALSGASGDQPGTAKPSIDDKGREVTVSGFGIGAVAWTER